MNVTSRSSSAISQKNFQMANSPVRPSGVRTVNLRGKYRNSDGTMTAAAIRARRPFFVRNMFLGAGFATFAGFCYWWTYRALTPDDFGDIGIPDIPEAELEELRKKHGARLDQR